MSEHVRIKGADYDRPMRRVYGAIAASIGGFFAGIALMALIGPIGALFSLVAGLVLPLVAVQVLGPKTVGFSEITVGKGVVELPKLGLLVTSARVRNGIDSIAQRSVVLDMVDGRVLRIDLDEMDTNSNRGAWILEQLGIGPSQATTQVPLRRMLGRFTLGFVTFFGTMLGASFFIPILARLLHAPGPTLSVVWGFAALMTLWVVVRFGKPHVVIGSDGLRIKGMWKQAFLRFADIERVERTSSGDSASLTIHLRNGKKRVLPIVAIPHERIAGLLERIERSRQASNEAGARALTALTRAGRSIDEWRDELGRLATKQASFREAAFEREDFERIVADPKAAAEHRIGAAYVLHRIDPEVGKERIRVAAQTTAEEELREALHAAAEGSLDEHAITRKASRG